MNSFIKYTITLLIMAVMAGCGGGDAFTQAGGGGGGVTGQPSLSLSLTDSSSAAITSISVDSPGTLSATVVDDNGNPLAGAVVSFTTTLATLNPTAGSALTNSSGVATVTLLAGTTTGADSVTAEVTVNGTTATGSKGYTVAAPSISLSSLTIGTSPLSALGTTSLTVTVLDGTGAPYTTPVDVAFSSICGVSGKATISSPITTVNGVATSNYLDQGCANTDTVTAALTIGGTTISKTSNLVVNPASAGSIQFVSATPQKIALKGTGGAGLQETSTVKFKVVDAGGNPVPAGTSVDFNLSTAVGGITFGPASATSDANGEVSTIISSGTVATAVRLFATVSGSSPVLTTQSDQMSITTGVPAQDHFSLSASTHNMEGWDFDGECSVLTVHASDHFSNPVPDGTAINFTAEGGQVGGDCSVCGNPKYCEAGGTCHTVNGQCTSVFLSSDLRPTNGRVTVLAYGIGEEGFTDTDGDGYVSANAERVDANGATTDMPEAWVDYNENSAWDNSEPFIDFNANGSHDAVDGLYNGVLCKSGGIWCDTTNKNVNVRRSTVIVMGGISAVIKASTDNSVTTDPEVFNTNPVNSNAGVALDSCTDGVAWTSDETELYLQITDLHGNALPGGTIIDATSTNGTVVLEPSSPLIESVDCVSGDSQFLGCPYTAPHSTLAETLFTLKMISDATQDTSAPFACTNTKSTGYLTVNVTTPDPHSTTVSLPIKITD